MSGTFSKMYATDETFREVANLLYGEGATELISKLTKEQERTQARIGLATNVVGIGAGVLGTKDAVKGLKNAPKMARGAGKLKMLKSPRFLAGAALGVQGANLAGDAVANRVLARASKKEVKKFEPGSADVRTMKTRAGKAALRKVNESPQVNQVKVETGAKLKKLVHKSAETDVLWEGEFSKVDADKRQVFGWASIVEMGGEPVYDLQGDFIEMDEIEKSAYDYVIKSRKGGDMHRRNEDDTPVHSSDMIESFMVTPEKIAKMGLPEGSLPTGWWVGFQVNDDDAWNLVKSGKRTAFSIHGRGNRQPMEA